MFSQNCKQQQEADGSGKHSQLLRHRSQTIKEKSGTSQNQDPPTVLQKAFSVQEVYEPENNKSHQQLDRKRLGSEEVAPEDVVSDMDEHQPS